MKIIRTVKELKEAVSALKSEGKSVGLVPTMGALHDGHISLVERARTGNDAVVVSVFVNPTQFNNPDDLRTYPRTEDADCHRLEKAGVDIAFIPSVEEMYPEPDTRVFDLGPVAAVMEGAMRPGHFNGVAQVVSRLFAMVNPDRAYFGEKDFQQIAVIRRMVELEKFPIEIVACPIKRESDGLALSSRNVRLSAHQREVAPNIHRVMEESLAYRASGASLKDVKHRVIDEINAYPEMEVEYYEIVNAADMQPVAEWSDCDEAVGCITVYLGDVRLIDNIKY
ncbi:MAG: pantoate--beta-alanine ligase [Candidatus Homeothermus sp.]|nr:pantoate--beta-alanine ligase [Candidatus Homeothermus sp.]